MLRITLNGDEKNTTATTVPALLEGEDIPSDQWGSLALARNGRVVPRAQWPQTELADGDHIEIVKPFVGG